MTPNPVIRLTGVVQTLEHVVFPAVDQSNSLAVEQCGLVLAQLKMLIGHLPWIGAYHQLCFDDVAATAEALPAGAGGPATMGAAAAVAEALAAARAQGDPLAGFHQIGTAIDDLLRAVAQDGGAEYRRSAERTIFAFSQRQSLRSRSWFREAGFDPAPSSVPDYAEMIAGASA